MNLEEEKWGFSATSAVRKLCFLQKHTEKETTEPIPAVCQLAGMLCQEDFSGVLSATMERNRTLRLYIPRYQVV